MTGSVPIQIAVWDAATAGNQICVTASTPQTLVAGAFQVTLPETCTAAVHANSDLWIEVLVSGLAIGRTKLGAVPYAVVAAESSCGPTTGPAMIDTGAGFCMDSADRNSDRLRIGDRHLRERREGGLLVRHSFALPNHATWGVSGTTAYRVSDLMLYTGNKHTFSVAVAAPTPSSCRLTCSTLSPPGPQRRSA